MLALMLPLTPPPLLLPPAASVAIHLDTRMGTAAGGERESRGGPGRALAAALLPPSRPPPARA